MRIDIHSNNTLGITQQILSVLANAQIDLIATEVEPNHTYINMQGSEQDYKVALAQLNEIEAVRNITKIDLLPAEKRQKHLNVLLKKLPDATFDIDSNGTILLASESAADICKLSEQQLEGKNLTEFIDEPLTNILSKESNTVEIHIKGKSYQADITPVHSNNQFQGAILILKSPERIGQQLSALKQSHDHGADNIIGNSGPLKKVLNKTQRFATLDLPVLITGETGTGKELLATAIHQQGNDNEAPFLALNCATLPENLLESELFGYAPGAFSGASRSGKPGLFELANGGTVFLDEIGEMSTYLQAKLLRFLQSYQFRRVGGTKEITVKVRLISATHRNLEQMAEQNTFREDLFYRLNVLNIEIPPLRERHQDIPLLVNHFVNRAATQISEPIPQITSQAIEKLSAYHWPGNIRQLENLLFRTIALLDSSTLDAQDIKLPNEGKTTTEQHPTATKLEQVENWKAAQQTFERQLLERFYPQYPSTRKLAQRLEVSHNKIAMKLKQYGID